MTGWPPLTLERLLRAAGAILIVAAIAMIVTPSGIAALFGLELGSAGDFMTRRYGAAGIVGLGVALWLSADRPAASAVLGGVAAWFFVQGGAAIEGLASGTVSGLAWLVIFVDPVLGLGALNLAARLRSKD